MENDLNNLNYKCEKKCFFHSKCCYLVIPYRFWNEIFYIKLNVLSKTKFNELNKKII
jgi:hypothetical protein